MSSISSTKGNSNTSAIKKKVRFRDDLVEIREYERNPEEWTSFVSFAIITIDNIIYIDSTL